MNFFINDFLPSTKGSDLSPSNIEIQLPNTENGIIRGILDGDLSVSMGNSFGPLIPDLVVLQDFFALANINAAPSWIGASAQMWRGTNPISFSLDMYLVNWKPDLQYEEQLRALGSFCTLSNGGNNGFTDKFIVKVHGGYRPNFLDSNKQFFSMSALDNASQEQEADDTQKGSTIIESTKEIETNLNKGDGTITVRIGNHFRLGFLLLTRLDVSPSSVEVYSPRVGGKKKPLYYRVGMSFQTARAALNTDLTGVFGGGK